jgi:hypothetical protein
MGRASALHRLQEIDLAGDRLQRRRHEIEAALGDSAELERIQAVLTAASAAAAEAGGLVRSAHHAVLDQRHKLKEAEQALYGGRVHNPRELTELQAETESLKRHLESLEDRYLEAMLHQDEAKEAERQAQTSVDSLAVDRSDQHAQLRAELGQIMGRSDDLEAEREAARASVSEEDLAIYERLRSRLGGIAVALLEDASCSACGLRVSAATEQLVRSGAQLILCDQCGRVLYGG